MEGHPQGARRAQAALPAHRARGDPRRRVHVGHDRAHRDDPADVRRPLRQHLQGHRRAWCAARRCSKSDFGAGQRPNDPRVARRRRAATPGVDAASPATCRIDYAQIVDTNGKAIGGGHGPPTLGFGWDPNPKLNQFHLVAGPARPRTDDEIVIDKRIADKGKLQGRPARDRAHRPSRRRSTRSSASRRSARPTAWRARRSRSSRCPRRSASPTRSASSTSISVVAKPGVSQDAGRGRHHADARADGLDKNIRGDHRARRSPRRTRTRSTSTLGFLDIGLAACSRSSR